MRVLHYLEIFTAPSWSFVHDLVVGVDRLVDDSLVVARKRALAAERPFAKVVLARERNPLRKAWARLTDPHRLGIDGPGAVAAAIRGFRPDVLHAHFGKNVLRLGALRRRLGLDLPLVGSFHGQDVNVLPRSVPGYQEAVACLAREPRTACTVPSDFLAGRLAALGVPADRIHIIPNAVHPRFLATTPPTLEPSRLRILCVGRLTEVKGHAVLLRALALVPGASLTLVGDGELAAGLRGLAVELGIAGRISWIPHVAHADLPDLIARHDAYVQPSVPTAAGEEESFGVAFAEAVAAGLPGIASRCGGLAMLGSFHANALFPPGDHAALAARLSALRDDPALGPAMQAAGRAHVAALAAAERVHPQVVALYRRL